MAGPAQIALELRDDASAQLRKFGDASSQEFRRATSGAATASDQIALLRKQYAALAEDAATLQKLPFLGPEEAAGLRTDKELMQQIRTEAQGFGVELGEEGAVGKGVYSSMTDLRRLRAMLSATIGLSALGFYVAEWGRIATAIGNAAQALEGYDKVIRAVDADARAASESALTSFGELDSATRIRLSLIADANQQSKETLQLEIQRTEQQLRDIRGQIDSVNRLKEAEHDLGILRAQMASEATSGGSSMAYADQLDRATELEAEISGLTSQLGPTLSGDLGKAYKQLAGDVDKGSKALTTFRVQLNELNEKPVHPTIDKTAKAQDRWNEAIAVGRVQLPPFISEIDRLQKALLIPDTKENNTLFAYAERNAARLQDGLQPLSATLKQLGIEMPKLSMPGSQSVLGSLVLDTGKLTEAQRMALPTARELQIVNQQLARLYPEMTASEREAAQQYLLSNGRLRQLVDTTGTGITRMNEFGRAHWAGAQAVRQLDSAIGKMLGTEQSGLGTLKAFTAAVLDQGRASEESAKQQTAANINGILQMILGQRMYAEVETIVQTAEGFASLATGNFWGAAQHFTSAAMWALVAKQSAPTGSAGGARSSVSGSAAVSSAVAGSSAASGTPNPQPGPLTNNSSGQAAQNNQNRPHTIQVIFQGDVYGAGGMREVIRKINGEVQHNRVMLMASHTIHGNLIK